VETQRDRIQYTYIIQHKNSAQKTLEASYVGVKSNAEYCQVSKIIIHCHKECKISIDKYKLAKKNTGNDTDGFDQRALPHKALQFYDCGEFPTA
jgi:hypothetical protein